MRAFSLTEGTSDKFWHIDVINDTVTVHFGRNGTKGQVKSTQFASATAADTEAEKLIASKVKKGYQEYDATSTMPAAPAPVAKTAAPSPAPAASAPTTPAPAAAAPAASPSPAPSATTEPAAVTTRPLAPADGAVASTLEPDDLGLELSRIQEAALGWGRPLDSYEPDTSFDVDATEAWVRRNGFKLDDWTSNVGFSELPFAGIPSAEQGLWWLWWYDLGPFRGMPTVKERLAHARAEYASGKAPSAPTGYASNFARSRNLFIMTASEVALVGASPLVQNFITEHDWVEGLLAARALVIPQLDPAERQRWLTKVRQVQPPHRWGQLALFADPDEYATEMMAAPSENLFASLATFAEILAPMPDPASAAELFERLEIRDPDGLSDWLNPSYLTELPIALAAAGQKVLPYLVPLMIASTSSSTITNYLRVLTSRLHGPGAVAAMVRIARESRAPELARAWLVDHPEAVAATSARFSASEADFLASVVREIVAARPDAFAGGVQNPTVAALVATLEQENAVVAIQPGSEPAWWQEAVAEEAATPVPEAVKGSLPIPKELPPYATAGTLPSIIIDGDKLSPEMVEAVLWSAIRGSNDPASEARPLVAAARARMDRTVSDRIALALFDGWMSSGSPTNQRALFMAAGFIGSDGLVQRLVPLIREWPGQSQHQRAVLGLRVLAATGTKSALQGISGIASKSKFKGVQEAAKESMNVLAALQGLTADQLADQVVPDGGLDERGTRVFSYGPRSFRVSLSPQGKLLVRDLDADGQPVGKVRTALPAPNSKDDPELAATAKSEFSLLRKQLTDLAKIQTARLEQAMVVGRTWTAEAHRDYLVNNPLLNSLIRPLIWEVIDSNGRTLVRVTEEREYLTIDEDVYEPAEDSQIRLAHPLDLSEAERAAWQQHLADYDLIAPIEQLDRAVFIKPHDLSGVELPTSLVPQGSIHPGSLVGILERNGWRRGNPADAGVVSFCWLSFPAFDQAIAIDLEDGLWTGMIAESGNQKIRMAMLSRPDDLRDEWYLDSKKGLDWATVNPRAFSETQRTFAMLAEKME